MTEWIDATAARERLGVRAQTLYAYVSRGRLRVDADPEDPRRSRYLAADVEVLAANSRRSRKRRDVAEGALAWGEPSLVSAISTVAHGRLFYRGRDAAALAETLTHEETAALLRDGSVSSAPKGARPPSGSGAIPRMLLTLAARAGVDPPLAGRRGAAIDAEAAALLSALVDAAAGSSGTGPVHVRLARAWAGNGADKAADAIRRALVLLADHELNPSAFAARVAASTGASLAAAALAGLSTLTGPRHGGAPAAIRRTLTRARDVGAREAITECVSEALPLPGFGHPLYSETDPRAEALLSRFVLTDELAALRDVARDHAGLFPNIDFALVALAEAYALPPEAPISLFATARAAGWIAHAIEQARSGVLIRPRARYVGPEPAPISPARRRA